MSSCYCTCRSDPTGNCPCHPINIVLLDEPNEDTVNGLIGKLAQTAIRPQFRGKADIVRRLTRKLRGMWEQQRAEQPADAAPIS